MLMLFLTQGFLIKKKTKKYSLVSLLCFENLDITFSRIKSTYICYFLTTLKT